MKKFAWSRRAVALILALAFILQGSTAPGAQAQTLHFHSYFPCTAQPVPPPVPVFSYRIVATYPHDPNAFTEGLFYDGGYLYESTGLTNYSSVRKEDLATARVLQETPLLGPADFGEGTTAFGSSLYELTWQTHTGYIYDKSSFVQTGQFSYPWEGWGLTQDGTDLIMSDGTPTIHFLNPSTLAEVRSISVTDRGAPVTNINELEYVNGFIYANIWMTDRLAVISPETGSVMAWIDLTGLRALQGPAVVNNTDAVLNGIAWNPATGGHLYVTGKLWPHLYEIQLVP